MLKKTKNKLIIWSIVIGALLILSMLVTWPMYRVWQRELAGKAQLKEAEWSRQIAVEEAKAKKESATMLAEAEIERAKGVAEANKIIGESLAGNEAYLRYLWIQGLQDGSSEVIYIPTEANLPILEAKDNR
jgi:regulator of protease activity HflC (stomatin/prohibitin superfamily)